MAAPKPEKPRTSPASSAKATSATRVEEENGGHMHAP
jgi:hypothetical protein